MAVTKREVKVILIVILVAGITASHYLTESQVHYYHIFYQGLYFVPVMVAGFWFGLRGALATSLSITVLYLPFTMVHWNGFSADDFNSVMEMVLYNVVALILGKLRDRERIMQRRLIEAESFAAMGKAVSELAHDLKTPLIAIGGMSRLVSKNLEEDKSSCQEKLNMIVQETQRMENMVKAMLEFSRPLELEQSKENINKVVGQCLLILSELTQKRKVKVQNQSLEDLPLISFDPDRMKQVFINLLANAIEASPEGETVSVHCYKKRKHLVIEVSDHGCGIPASKKKEVFYPFFTTKKDGTGLGLPIAKKIVEAHQGYLEVLDNPKTGVTFRVIIPIL